MRFNPFALTAALAGVPGVRVVVVRVVNAQGVSERRPQDEIEKAIVRRSRWGSVDVWLLCEIAWADLEHIAARRGLYALQYGDRGSPDAGVGILSRKPITKARKLRGTVATREGRGVRDRPLVSGRTFGVRFTAGHAPPASSPVARGLFIARARLARGVVGCDWNRGKAWMRASSRRLYRGVGVLGVLVPRRLSPSRASSRYVGSDHLTCDVRLLVPVRRRRAIR